MNLSKIFILILILSVTAVGCRKVNNDDPKPTGDLTMNDLVISDDFKWNNHTDIKLNIGVETSQPMTLRSKISVFKGDPADGGKLLTSGAASPQKHFEATLRVPATLSDVYLMAEFPFGLTKVEKVAVSNLINFTFDDLVDNGNFKSTSGFKATTDIGPDCDDCDVYITTGGSHTITGGLIYCIDSNISTPINITYESWNSGGTLQVCGTATISTIGFTENAKLVVTQNGNLTINSVNTNWGNNTITVYENATLSFNNAWTTQGQSVENQGTLNVNGNFGAQLLQNGFTNSGVMNVSGRIEINGSSMIFNNFGAINHSGQTFRIVTGGTLNNDGEINISDGDFEISSNSFLNNNGPIDVTGDIQINAGSQVTNSCSIIASGDFTNNSSSFVNNTGFLKAGVEFDMNSTGVIEMNNGSMISTVDFEFDQGQVIASGSKSSVYVSGTLQITGANPTFSGNIEVATDDLDLVANTQISDHFLNGATVVGLDFITNSIPAGPCNPDGIGPQIVDTDGDGVPDDLDDFPNDEYRAFNYQFPEPGGYITLMFEDLWPGTGDYDFNDLVIGVSGTEITNADNDVVETYINLDVKAVGAGLKNGFGWQYANIPPSAIEQVTGMVLSESSNIVLNPNGTEAAQDSAVIIAIENVEDVINRVGGSMYNTVDNGNVGVSDPVTIHVLFGETTPLARELFDGEVYNIFLIKNQQRGTEIHQADRQPTNLMTYPWGESNDTSDPLIGRYYKTASNLPWALIVYDNFQWPVEGIPIIEAYPDFASWAQSGGSTESNWYENPDPTKIWSE